MFTQPLMYQVIAKQPNVLKLYSESLIKAGVIPAEEVAVCMIEIDEIDFVYCCYCLKKKKTVLLL